MIVLPVVLCLILPLVLLLAAQAAGQDSPDALLDPDIARMMANLPPSMKAELEGLNGNQQMIVLMLGYLFAPLFLILPIMTASNHRHQQLCRRKRAQDDRSAPLYACHRP